MTTDFRFEWQDTQGGDRALARESYANAHKPSGVATFMAAFEQESLFKRAVDFATDGKETVDPNYRLTPERVTELQQQYNVPQEYMGALNGALNDNHAERITQNIKREIDNRELIARAGWGGTAASMIIGTTDPIALATNFTPAGMAAWMSRGGALKGALKAGFVAGGTNAALEAGMAASDYTRDPSEIAQAGLMGLAMGAPLGGLAGAFARSAKNAHSRALLEGHPLTPEGEAKLASVSAPVPVEMPAEPPMPLRDRLQGVAKNLGVTVNEAPGGYQGGRGFVDIPGEGAAITGGATADEVFAHELGHAVLHQRGLGFKGFPVAEMRNQISNWDELVAASKDFRPGIWNHETASVSNHARKPDEIVADAIASVYAGKRDASILKPMMEKFGITERDLGLPNVAPEASPGFGAGSVGAAQAGIIDEPKSKFAGTVLKLGPLEIPLRFDAFSTFERTGNPHMQRFANMTLDDPVGKVTLKGANGEVIPQANRSSAVELADIEFKRFETRQHEAFQSAFQEYAQRNELSLLGKQQAEGKFFEDVANAVRDPLFDAKANPEAARAAGEIQQANAKWLKAMQDALVDGADLIKPNDHYLMRKWNYDKLTLLMADKEVRPQVTRLVSEAIRNVRPLTEVERADTIAKQLLKTLRDIPTDKKNLGFLTDQGRERLAATLRQGKVLEDQEIDDILSWVFNERPKAEGDSPRMKIRTLLDEAHKITWTDANGEQHGLALTDLFHNDARTLQRIYSKQASGLIALANVGIRSRADYDAIREAARVFGQDAGVKPEKLARQLEDMDRVMRYLSGMPMFEGFGSTVERGMRFLRNFNFITYMAQGFFAQFTEAGQVLALQTTMALRTGVGEYDAAIRRAAAGTMDKRLAKDLMAMGTVAQETALRRPVPEVEAYGGLDGNLTRLDNAAAKGAYYTSRLSGMAPLTDYQRGKIASLYSQRLMNIAVGAEKMDAGLLKRLATNGLEGSDLENMLERLKKYATIDEKSHELVSVNYDTWEREHKRSFDDFRLAVYREGHRAIQEITLGSSPLWMHHGLARLIMQFRSFVTQAWTKQTLYGIAHMDMQTFLTWTFSQMFGSLGYVAQTSLNYAGSPDELEKRLTPQRIAAAGFQRAGFSSMIPAAIDTVGNFTFGKQPFSYGRTTNLGTGFITGNPTFSTVNKAMNTASSGLQDLTTSDHMWTRKDVQGGLGLLPNYFGLKTFYNDFASRFPTQNYMRSGQH